MTLNKIKFTTILFVFLMGTYSHCQNIKLIDSVGIPIRFPSVVYSAWVNGNANYIFLIDENYSLNIYDYSGKKSSLHLDTAFAKKLQYYASKRLRFNILTYINSYHNGFAIKVYDTFFLLDSNLIVQNKYDYKRPKLNNTVYPMYNDKLFLSLKDKCLITFRGFTTAPIGGMEARKTKVMRNINTFLTCSLSDSTKSYFITKYWGRYDTIYHKCLLPYLIRRCDADINQEFTNLYFSQAATHAIEVWDIQHQQLIKRFGVPAKHFNPQYHTPVAWNKKTDNSRRHDYSSYLQRTIECTTYENLEYDDAHHLLFRIYRVGKKDTVRHHIKTKQEWKAYKKKNKKLCSSELPEVWENQVKLEQSKPYGLQIYNEKQELVYDEIMPTPFNILKIENDEIWVHGKYDEVTEKYWIYKYTIELPKP